MFKLFSKKSDDKEAIEIMLDFVEGRMSIEAYYHDYYRNESLMAALKKPLDLEYFNTYPNYSTNFFDLTRTQVRITKDNYNSIGGKLYFHGQICEYLDYFKIEYVEFAKYAEDFDFLLSIQPDWLDSNSELYIEKEVIDKMPQDISRPQQIKWCKAKIKELFRYDKSYPRWAQEGEWPIVNGKPLVFREKLKPKLGDERRYFVFYDPDTMIETIVEQLY